MPGLDELADELYTLPPSQFVDARTAVVTAARAAGDKAIAAQLAALRKPTVTAWLANRLVRTQPDLVAGALALGPALRDATIAGDRTALRDLARHRQVLLGDLIAAARALAQDADQAFTATTQRELEATFVAAASDPDAAGALATGRLTAPLSSAGLGFELGAIPPERAVEQSVPRDPSVTPPAEATTAAPRETTAQEQAQALARHQTVVDAEQALAAARLQDADALAALDGAESALAAADAAEKEAAAAHQAARAAVSDARADLTAARADVTMTQRAVAAALAALERARRR